MWRVWGLDGVEGISCKENSRCVKASERNALGVFEEQNES